MHARVLRLRQFGVLQEGQLPPDDSWACGVFEMTDTGFAGPPTVKRLILRDARSCPGMGLLMELFRPELVQVRATYLRLRGIEAVPSGTGQTAGMVQEWMVLLVNFG